MNVFNVHKFMVKRREENGNEEDIFFHYKSFRRKCNGIDVNRGYDISNPTNVTYFASGPPL